MHKPTKVALVTGAARRVGAEIAHTLHAAGMNIVLHYNHSAAEAKRLCTIFNEQRPHSAVLLQADLSHIDLLKGYVQQAIQAWGRLDVLVNNASRYYKTELRTTTRTDWDDLMRSNLKAPYFLCQAAVDELEKACGCIVNIADIHAERPMQDYAVYSIAKAGLVMMTKALAKELGPHIRVNAVAPGAVMWPEGENTLNEESRQTIIRRTALHRHGSAKDIAKAVLFLVRDADYVTGQVIAVDGGRSLSM